MKQGLLGLIMFSLLGLSAAAQTNQWTKPTSGNWEQSYWSLGLLPGIDQQLVAIDNYGWKAVAIGANTTANYPQSLSLSNLLIDAPTNSRNTLLLNWANFNVPLVVSSNLTVGTNGALASHYSALRATNAYIDGTASFSDYATEDFGQLTLRSGGTAGLTNGIMTCSNLTFYNGTFTQCGGAHVAHSINLPTVIDPSVGASGAYYLQGGALTSQSLGLGYAVGPFGAGDGRGALVQSGGVHTNSVMNLVGYYHPGGGTLAGYYRLDNGVLVSGSIHFDGGAFIQNGGTNLTQEIDVKGGSHFGLNGGELVASNITIAVDPYVGGLFDQSNGTLTAQGRLLIEESQTVSYGGYRLLGGNLVASNMEIHGVLYISGTVSNMGILTLSRFISSDIGTPGNIVATAAIGIQYLGQMQILSGGTVDMHYFFVQAANATVMRFADSHTSPWNGPLQIRQWGVIPGDHIYFGTNAQGLTTAQLAQITFSGSNTNYPAKLLATGELVPAVPPPLVATNSNNTLVLSWPGGYELVSATNVNGTYLKVPGATSPFTNAFTDPQRFFRLHLPSP
jgi:hypothetical protein